MSNTSQFNKYEKVMQALQELRYVLLADPPLSKYNREALERAAVCLEDILGLQKN